MPSVVETSETELTPDQEAGRDYFIERPRLTHLLDEATAPVIMLIAPAGFGKTTLARQWLASRRRGWYRGSPAAADVAALAVGLARAASEIVPGAGTRMGERLRATGTPEQDVEPLAELLAEDLENWPSEAWLAFDDYHFACESGFAEEFVERVLALSPLRLFLTSRKRPSWATSRRLLYGDAYEIGRSLLAMSQEEAELVLSHRQESEASGLVALADGWPAVIGLAALTDDFDLPDQGVPEALYRYFAEELYQVADEELRWSLCQLALSSSVAPEVAEALLHEKAENALRDGRRLGFIVPSEHGLFEIHPLLRGFLEEKFRELAGEAAQGVVELLVRTHLHRSDWDDAFLLIERFFERDLLVELFEKALPPLLLEARLPTLARWLECASAQKVDAPVIDLAEGELAFRAGDRTRSEALGLQAARRLDDDHPLIARSFALAGASAHRGCNDLLALDYYAAAERVAASDQDWMDAVWGRFLSMIGLENEREAARALGELDARDDRSPDAALRFANGCLMLATMRGEIGAAVERLRRTLPLLEKTRDPMITSSALNSYAATLVLSGRYADARDVARRELDVADEYRLAFVRPHAMLNEAGALWGLRMFRHSIRLLGEIQRTCGDDQFLLMNVGTTLARIYLALSSPDRALRSLEEHLGQETTPGMEAEYNAWWGLVSACKGRADDARAHASAATAMSQRTEVVGVVPWIAAITDIREGSATANESILSAYRNALQVGNLDGFVAAYRVSPEIVDVIAGERDLHRGLRLVLSRASDQSFGRRLGFHIPGHASPHDSDLSKREREVLELLVQGATNREIAQTLFISDATVKVHLRHIYSKFGVRSRIEAVVRALEADAT
jgi:LuxR family maltose regulon positive regulatory protein